jgi:hypothetical protein
MMQKSTTFTTIFRVKSATFTTILHVKKCHFHYDMQKNNMYNDYFIAIYPKRTKQTSRRQPLPDTSVKIRRSLQEVYHNEYKDEVLMNR